MGIGDPIHWEIRRINSVSASWSIDIFLIGEKSPTDSFYESELLLLISNEKPSNVFPSDTLSSQYDSISSSVNSRWKFETSSSPSILGINEAFNYFLLSFYQFIFANQGWLFKLAHFFSLSSGFFVKRASSRLRIFLLQFFGKTGSVYLILSASCPLFFVKNGGIPLTIS